MRTISATPLKKAARPAAAIFATLVAFAVSRGTALGAEFIVSCGAKSTTVSTPRPLRDVETVRITVDPANNCHVDLSLRLNAEPRKHRATRPAIRHRHLARRTVSNAKCFSFAGRTYCE